MSLRMPHKVGQPSTQSLGALPLDPDWLATFIREANQPVPIQQLVRQVVRTQLVDDSQPRAYAAGRAYGIGERVRLLDGRLGRVASITDGGNAVQGSFRVIALKLPDGGAVRLAAEADGAPQYATPESVSDETVDRILAEQGQEVTREIRQTLASDPRFITLYYRNGEFGCLREFFPAMSPDVLDAALALLLDTFFDQIPVSRVTDAEFGDEPLSVGRSLAAEALFATDPFEEAVSAFPETRQAEEAVRRQFDTVQALWARAQEHGHTWDSAQMARVFVQPLLRSLGWSSVPLHALSGAAEGTYALCADDAACAELFMDFEAGESLSPRVLALVQATPWDQVLDQPPVFDVIGPASATSHAGASRSGSIVPSHRMVGELRRTEVRWGILTNGRVWRLYSSEANSMARTYYEVDLASLFSGLMSGERPGAEQYNAFQRWWLLFRRSSYTAGSDGRSLVERLRLRIPRDEVRARELLRERLLGKALPAIAGGYIAYRRQRSGVAEETPATLQAIHRASVFLVTRLLFTLIAEARGLLPGTAPEYRPYSLTTQAQWATDRIARDLPISAGVYTTPRYDLVIALLHRIGKGDGDKDLPSYGRLLFDPLEHEDQALLERARLSDKAIGCALDALYRAVDYASLDARDLLDVCGEMIGTQIVVIDANLGDVVITRQGAPLTSREVLPDYVVTTSVTQALAPVLKARGQAFADAMVCVVELRRKLRRALDRRRRAALYAEWEAAARQARQALMAIRVCDPAMGAGAFLLSAVDVLTDGIIDALQAYHGANRDIPRDWNPVYKLIDDVRRDIGEELVRQGVDPGDRHLEDATILSRLVAQRCVFGVAQDRASLDVAATSLWLHTFIPGMPLSYLEHHLRSGNGVLGTDLTSVSDDLGLPNLCKDIVSVTGSLYPLTERVDSTALDVRWSAGQFARTQEALAPYRLLLDLCVSASLGNAEAEAALGVTEAGEWSGQIATAAPAWISAQAEAEGFFHWELEFPEIHIDWATDTWMDDAGFDVVLGNPPWLAMPDDALLAYYASRYARDDDTEFNVHHAYLALARHLVPSGGGRTYYVLSREWLASPTGGIQR